MKITCPNCEKKFKPQFTFGIVPSWERDPNTGEQIYDEEQTCTCPNCESLIYREEIDHFEDVTLQFEEMNSGNHDLFNDEQEEDSEEE